LITVDIIRLSEVMLLLAMMGNGSDIILSSCLCSIETYVEMLDMMKRSGVLLADS
jgi:hypothetical protein